MPTRHGILCQTVQRRKEGPVTVRSKGKKDANSTELQLQAKITQLTAGEAGAVAASCAEQVRVELSLAEGGVNGKGRGPAIVEAAKKQGVSLLVVGQKKRSSVTWRLLSMWITGVKGGGGGGAGCASASAADYCVQHAACMALAVRRRRGGGYLISTRRQRDFWLLA